MDNTYRIFVWIINVLLERKEMKNIFTRENFTLVWANHLLANIIVMITSYYYDATLEWVKWYFVVSTVFFVVFLVKAVFLMAADFRKQLKKLKDEDE